MGKRTEYRLTQETFLKRAKEVHGDKYDYSKSVYKNTRIKVIINCPIHGDFEQIAYNHLKGQGCPLCGKKYGAEWQKGNWEHFIEESKERFGDIYEFPNIKEEFENSHSKITIKCKKCGNVFTKIACDHICSAHGGCKCMRVQATKRTKKPKPIKTAGLKKENRADNKAFLKFKETMEKDFTNIEVDYSTYINTQLRVKCRCKKCGREFLRKPNTFVFGNLRKQCPYCGNGDKLIITNLKDFKQRANKIHNNKYDYSKFVYISSEIKSIVICHEKDKFGNEHGEFEVTPHAHIGSMHSGCPKCTRKHFYTLEEWKREAVYVHGNDYDYSLIEEYRGARVKMPIICHKLDYNGNEHGIFYQDSNQHLTGQGCPKCVKSHIERKIEGILEKEGLNFKPQANREDLPWLERLSLDIYIPELKTAIEIQGDEHFRPIKYWGGEKTFKSIVERDDRKNRLCQENGINLLYYCEKNHEDYRYPLIKNVDGLLKILVDLQNSIN